MAWTAQAGLGQRTVALSLKVFIVVMCYAHARLGVCTAQQTLPETLRNYLQAMREKYCSEGSTTCDGYSRNCTTQLNSLCEQICNPTCPYNCWTTSLDTIPLCRQKSQTRFCGYSDAVVCQEDRGACVYHSDMTSFCIWANQEESYSGCEPLVSADPSVRIPTEGDTPGVTVIKAQAATARATTLLCTTAHGTTNNNGTNVAPIVVGPLFALLVLLVIICAVMLYLRRQGRLPFFIKRTAKPAEMPSVEVGASLSVNRLQFPEPSTPHGNFDYAYIHCPPTTNPSLENQAYASVHEEDRYSSFHDVTNGQEDEQTTDGIKNTYFGLIQTVKQKTENEAPGTAESQGVSSATGEVAREDINISFPLTQHKFRNITSDGYEFPMVKPTAANH